MDVLDPVVRPEEPVLDGQGVVPDMKQKVIARGIGGKTVRTDIRTEAQGIGIAGACVMIEEEIGAIPEVKYIGVIARSADQSVIADTAAQNVIPPLPARVSFPSPAKIKSAEDAPVRASFPDAPTRIFASVMIVPSANSKLSIR